jgi:hypothetical protein
VKALREQARETERKLVACAGGLADFNKACGGVDGDAHGEACGAAHEHVGRLAIDEDGRRAVGVWAEMDAVELNFAERQSSVRADGIDARFREEFSGGL